MGFDHSQPCQCDAGCNPGWCLKRAHMLVERNGRELYVCHNCYLSGDRRIEDGHGYRCPACNDWNYAGMNELCPRCKNEKAISDGEMPGGFLDAGKE